MAYNPIKWIIQIHSGKKVVLTQNPSSQEPTKEKKVSYEETLDGNAVRVSPPTPNIISKGMSFRWDACNAEQKEFLESIFDNDYQVSIVSHHGLSEIKRLGDTSTQIFNLTGWQGFFDEFNAKERIEFNDIYYDVTVKMNHVKELTRDEIEQIVDS